LEKGVEIFGDIKIVPLYLLLNKSNNVNMKIRKVKLSNVEKRVMSRIHQIVREEDYNTALNIILDLCTPIKTMYPTQLKWVIPIFWREEPYFIASEHDETFDNHELIKGMKNLLSYFGEGYNEFSDQFLEKIFEI